MVSNRIAVLPARSEDEGVSTYADRARRALRSAGPAASSEWKRVYESGLAEAYRQRDMAGLSAIATLAAVALQSEGMHEEAIVQIDFAVAMARSNPDASVHLLGGKAIFEALLGRAEAAEQTLRAAQKFIPRVESDRSRLGHDTNVAIVRCVLLKRTDLPKLTNPIADSELAGYDWQASALKSWLIPYLFAGGTWEVANPWIESLRIQAMAVDHPARAADAQAFKYATELVRAEPSGPPEIDSDAANPYAGWRVALLRLRHCMYFGDWDTADTLVEDLSKTEGLFRLGFPMGLNPYVALVKTYRGELVDLTLSVPSYVNLVNLPAIFAGMETVAITGTQRSALEWLEWSADSLPPFVTTALEWPVAVQRIRGLLEVRAGKLSRGVTSLREAMRWAEQSGYRLEAALAQLQLGELLLHGDVRTAKTGEARRFRNAGWAALQALNVSPMAQAYSAARALALSRDDQNVPRLTPRETEILSLLAEGMTYRQVGARLGISWRTVQLHAYHVYEKLDVSGKLQAVEAARELNIL